MEIIPLSHTDSIYTLTVAVLIMYLILGSSLGILAELRHAVALFF